LPAAAQDVSSNNDACSTGAQAHWAAAVQHYRANEFPQAATETDAIVAACGDDARAETPRMMRAELALRASEPQRALDLLESGPSQRSNYSRWLRIDARLSHADQVNALAQSLIADSGAALERAGLRHVETFEAGGYSIAGYEGRLNQGSFIRFEFFLIRPLAGGLPISIAVSRDNFDLGGPPAYFVDLYICAGHVTLDEFSSNRPPDYRRARAAVDAWVTSQGANAISATTPHTGMCAFTQYITPGLE